jgi:hypothetical protein
VSPIDEQVRRRYLLGTLPDAEAEALERELLADDVAYEELLALEDELFHDYARGGLPESERMLFEEHRLASPDARQRLARSGAIQRALNRPSISRSGAAPSASRSRYWLASLAAALLLAAGAWWLWQGGASGPREIVQAPPTPSTAPSPVASPSAPVLVAALEISPGLTRAGAGSPRVTLPARATALRLQLRLPAGSRYTSYRAVLLSAEGQEVWTGAGLLPSGSTLSFEIPAGRVPEGDYELRLASETGSRTVEVADYAFRVLR